MPGYVDRYFRRPLDESMLLRVVVVSGLVSGTDIARFYATESGLSGSRSLEDYLHDLGLTPEKLDAIKRAYVQTEQVGSVILRFMRSRGADDTKMRAATRALNACETAQLMAIKKGKPAKPIGEMMVELGHITEEGLEKIISNQGMARKINHYEEQIRLEKSLPGRLGLLRLRKKLRFGRLGVGLVLLALLSIALFNLWYLGWLEGRPDPKEAPFGGAEFRPADTRHNTALITQHYGNMLTELRFGSISNARHYKAMLDACFGALEEAGTEVDDKELEHIRRTYDRLDFQKVKDIPRKTLPLLTAEQLEKRLRR